MDLYEIWKITKYKNYEVSNRGRVRNKNTKRILKPFLNHDIKENVYHSINVLGVNPANGLEKTHEKHKRKVVRSDGKIYNSIDEAKADIKKPNAHIVEVCQGKLNKTVGYGWSYL